MVVVPVASIATVSDAASTSLTAIHNKLKQKVNKHLTIRALAVAKHDTINSSVS